MRTRILLFTLLFTSLFLKAQWTWTDISPDYGQARPFHIGCHIPNESTVWAVPFWLNGTINPKFAVTADSGENWTVGTPNLSDPALVPVLVYSLNADTAWLTTQQMPNGTYGSVVVTHDGGTSWSELDIPYIGNEVPIAVHFYDGMEGIVIAQNFFTATDHVNIYRTIDGGINWDIVSPDLQAGEVMWVYNGESIMERIGDKLFIGTGLGRVLRSLDRGITWDVTDLELGAKRGMNAVAFEDDMTGIILSTYDLDSLNFGTQNGISLAAKTTDGGNTWNPINIPPLIEHIEYVPNSGGVYIGGMGYTGFAQFYISKDGGNNWKEKGSPGMINIVFANTEMGYAFTFGSNNGIVRYTGDPLIFDDNPLPPSDWEGQGTGTLPSANFTGNYVHDMTILDPQNVWAISTPSRINNFPPYSLKTTDGGQNWESTPISNAAGFRGYDIHAFDNQTAFVTTNNNSGTHRLLKTEDGGNSWIVNNETTASGGYIHFFNDMEGLIINDDFIEITQDGGNTWTTPLSPPDIEQGDIIDLFSWAFHLDETVGDHFWYISPNSKILISPDKGQSWEIYDTPVAFNSIAMKDSLNGLAVETNQYNTELYNDSTTVFQTNDGGQTWEILTTLSDAFTIQEIDYVENSMGSYVGSSFYNSSTSFTNDDGQTWEFIDENFFPDVMRFYDHETGWAVKTWVNEGFEPVIYKWVGEAFPELIVDVKERTPLASIVDIYPSPFSDHISIDFKNLDVQNAKIDLLDFKGKLIQTHQANQVTHLQNLSTLTSGVYLVKITSNNLLYTKRVIKQ